MEPINEDKAKSRSVALPLALWDKVDQTVEAKFGGNRSAFFRDLLERYDTGAERLPEAQDKDALISITQRFAPALMDEMRAFCVALPKDEAHGRKRRPVTQALIIAEMLNALLKRLPQELGLYGDWELFTRDEYLDAVQQAETRTRFQARREEVEEPLLNEEKDGRHVFQKYRRPELTGSDREAVQAWFREHPATRKTTVHEVDQWLDEHHPKAEKWRVFMALNDKGIKTAQS